MPSVRLLLSAALAMAAGCALQPQLTQITTEEGVKEGIVTLREYSSARRDEALKLIASECPAGYDVIEEGPVRVTRPFIRTTIQVTEYRITYRERNFHSPPPLPAGLEARAPGRPEGEFRESVERDLMGQEGDVRTFKSLSEREILALAISLEEDARIYADLADGLKDQHPAEAERFRALRADEDGHRHRLLDLYRQRFGERKLTDDGNKTSAHPAFPWVSLTPRPRGSRRSQARPRKTRRRLNSLRCSSANAERRNAQETSGKKTQRHDPAQRPVHNRPTARPAPRRLGAAARAPEVLTPGTRFCVRPSPSRLQEAPIRMPAKNTSSPPTTTWNSEAVQDVSM
jgi:hypothetical protein